MLFRRAALLAPCLLLIASTGKASPISVALTGAACIFGPLQQGGCNSQLGTSGSVDATPLPGTGLGVTASASGGADYGHIFGSVNLSRLTTTYQTDLGNYSSSALARFDGMFFDDFVVSGNAPAQILVHGVVNVSSDQSPGNDFEIQGGAQFLLAMLLGADAATCSTSISPAGGTALLTCNPGDVIIVQGAFGEGLRTLTDLPMGNLAGNLQQDSGKIDGSAHLYIDVLTPGASLAFDSGHDYSSPASVPEPSSFSTIIIGLSLFLVFRLFLQKTLTAGFIRA